MADPVSRPRVLLLAENCNPEWPSLPVVGYKYARALTHVADVALVTHVRNRPNIEKAAEPELAGRITYVDNEWMARPLYRLARILRGGDEVAWSTNQMMAYLPYVVFERQALRAFRDRLRRNGADGGFDLVHRITPMSPTLPSYAAGRTPQPFVLGPLNGNLAWPEAFRGEQKREREGLRRLREFYRYMPYSRTTFSRAAAILAAFPHTIADLPAGLRDRIIDFPEIGFDETLFHGTGRKTPFAGGGAKRFLFAGRLVPYKVPEVAVRAFAGSDALRAHRLDIVGDGPERSRLEAMVAEAGAADRIRFLGRKTQVQVAEMMRAADAFVFPSIRELGAGVVVEAMASGALCLVADYGAPGHLVAGDLGVRVPLQPLEALVQDYRRAMEDCLAAPGRHAEMAARAAEHARTHYTWAAKADYTAAIYADILAGRQVRQPGAYA